MLSSYLYRLLSLLLLANAGCDWTSFGIARPWDDLSLESVDLVGTTMRARRLDPASLVQSLPLGRIGAGEVSLHGAVSGGSGGRMEVHLSQPDGIWPWAELRPSRESCAISAPTWQPCRLRAARNGVDTVLTVRIHGTPDEVFVSSPLVIPDGVEPGPPVFLILADTLRFDRLVTYAPDIPLGHHLDALARDGVVFERMYSSSSWTRTAIATLFTGLDAHSHGVLGRTDVLPASIPGLPQQLRRAGWRTSAWSTNANILPIWGFDSGFDSFVDLGALDWVKNKTDAATVFDAVLAELDRQGLESPFHYIHLMDPHGPYLPGPEDLEAVSRDPRLVDSFPGETVTARAMDEYRKYLAEIRDMDRKIGVFLEELGRRGVYDRAMILVVSDHGEEFLDHGGMYHGRTLYDEVLRVPAILKLPGNALASTRIAAEVGLAGVAPTILEILAVEGLGEVDGQSLWNTSERSLRQPATALTALLRLDTHHKAAVVEDLEKLIVDYARPGDQFFDLRSDPLERRDLLPAQAENAAPLRATLDSSLARRSGGWHIRACGGSGERWFRLGIRVDGALRGVDLEAEDVLRQAEKSPEGATWEAELHLAPVSLRREFFGRIVEEMAPDEDEIVIPASEGAIAVTSLDKEPLRYALGVEAQTRTRGEVLLRPEEPSVVKPGTPVTCWGWARQYSGKPSTAEGERVAYLRIWFVPPVGKREDAEVDAAVRERLRALGYDW